jgi:hypothetical protein
MTALREERTAAKGYSEALRNEVDTLLQEGYRLWAETGLSPPGAEERHAAADAAGAAYDGPHARELAAACQCFCLFRALHRLSAAFPESATLLGDWFFSQVSLHLIPLDSVPLILAFSDFLARDAALDCDAGGGAGDPLAFIPAVLRAVRT